MSAIDEFGGSAVSSAWENLWPFNRARLEISTDAITCNTPSGRRRAVRSVWDEPRVTLTRYRPAPVCVRTFIWIESAGAPLLSDTRATWRTYIDTGEFPPIRPSGGDDQSSVVYGSRVASFARPRLTM